MHPRSQKHNLHAAEEVHAVDANGGIVFDPQIDMFADTKSEVARLAEVCVCAILYSFTLRPRSRISSAFGPRTVTCTAIFSLRRMPNVRTVYRALPA